MTAVAFFLVLAAAPPNGDAVVRGRAGPSDIVVTTTRRLAGAVHSVTWNGAEFIDSTDHGRQLQSAASFDCGRPNFWPECFNPTEAGSVRDGAGPTSTSRLRKLTATANALDTTTRMAFWLPPGGKSAGRPALNAAALSDHLIRKRLTVGTAASAHAIDYDATFTVPAGEHHTLAQFEAVTGYMPAVFDTFFTFDPKTGLLAPLTDGPGEQSLPVVLSTRTGSHAMGVMATGPPPAGSTGPGYGRWRFAAEKVVKWNCVYRVADTAGVTPGDYRFRMAVAVGSRENVRATMAAVAAAK